MNHFEAQTSAYKLLFLLLLFILALWFSNLKVQKNCSVVNMQNYASDIRRAL